VGIKTGYNQETFDAECVALARALESASPILHCSLASLKVGESVTLLQRHCDRAGRAPGSG